MSGGSNAGNNQNQVNVPNQSQQSVVPNYNSNQGAAAANQQQTILYYNDKLPSPSTNLITQNSSNNMAQRWATGPTYTITSPKNSSSRVSSVTNQQNLIQTASLSPSTTTYKRRNPSGGAIAQQNIGAISGANNTNTINQQNQQPTNVYVVTNNQNILTNNKKPGQPGPKVAIVRPQQISGQNNNQANQNQPNKKMVKTAKKKNQKPLAKINNKVSGELTPPEISDSSEEHSEVTQYNLTGATPLGFGLIKFRKIHFEKKNSLKNFTNPPPLLTHTNPVTVMKLNTEQKAKPVAPIVPARRPSTNVIHEDLKKLAAKTNDISKANYNQQMPEKIIKKTENSTVHEEVHKRQVLSQVQQKNLMVPSSQQQTQLTQQAQQPQQTHQTPQNNQNLTIQTNKKSPAQPTPTINPTPPQPQIQPQALPTSNFNVNAQTINNLLSIQGNQIGNLNLTTLNTNNLMNQNSVYNNTDLATLALQQQLVYQQNLSRMLPNNVGSNFNAGNAGQGYVQTGQQPQNHQAGSQNVTSGQQPASNLPVTQASQKSHPSPSNTNFFNKTNTQNTSTVQMSPRTANSALVKQALEQERLIREAQRNIQNSMYNTGQNANIMRSINPNQTILNTNSLGLSGQMGNANVNYVNQLPNVGVNQVQGVQGGINQNQVQQAQAQFQAQNPVQTPMATQASQVVQIQQVNNRNIQFQQVNNRNIQFQQVGNLGGGRASGSTVYQMDSNALNNFINNFNQQQKK